jgi:hypothetical protein
MVFIFIFPDLNVLVQFSFKSRFHGEIAMSKLLTALSLGLPPVTNKKMWRIGIYIVYQIVTLRIKVRSLATLFLSAVEEFDICGSLLEKFYIYGKIKDRDVGIFFRYPSIVVLRYPFWASNFSIIFTV